jgi:serine protease Do
MIRFITHFFATVAILLTAVFLYRLTMDSSKTYDIFDLISGRKFVATAPLLGQSSTPRVKVDPNDLEVLTSVNQAMADLTASVVPSVVSIDTKKTVNVPHRIQTDPFGFGGYLQYKPTERPAGLGSGAIVSEEGHIITNHHVIASADEIQVTCHGGSQFEAEVVGSDPIADIAVLKIKQPDEAEPVKFQALPFGDSDVVRVGEMALAIGNPFGLNETVTRGIISAKQRQLDDSASEYFQVDAVINPGNSGGPLVNIKGELIGVNVAIFTGQENVKVWQGIGLSIPSNEAREIYEAIAHDQPLERGFLGVELDTVPENAVRAYRLTTRGALIRSVAAKSPAEAAGLKRGDIVTGFDGKNIHSPQDFIIRSRKKRTGDTADLKVIRQGREIMLQAQFASKSASSTFKIKKISGQKITESIGIQVADITEQQRDALGIPQGFPAILISHVQPGSQAETRFKAGDLIHFINQDHISSVDMFYKILENLTEERSIMILSRNGERFAAVLNF